MEIERGQGVQTENSLQLLKQNLIEYVKLSLGDQIIDIELDAEHYETAYRATIGTYRQRAQNAYEESYTFLELVDNVSIYTLPEEVMSVRQLYRRTFGDATGPYASNFDPFSQASMNVYLMNFCLLYTSPSPRDRQKSRMPSSA